MKALDMAEEKKKIRIALLDSGVDVLHQVFFSCEISQYAYHDNHWERADTFKPKHGHGTGVASIITKNSENVLIHSFILFDDKLSVKPEKLISALHFIEDEDLCDIVHMSFGVKFYNKELEDICQRLYDKGIILISAFDNIGSVSFPAAFNTVIGVDASFRCLKPNDFVYLENSIINLKAKGGNQRIAWLDNTYIINQGSSFAAPYATAYITGLLQKKYFSFADILGHFKKISQHIYRSEPEVETTSTCFPIQKAIVFPFNKETTSLLRFSDLLNFDIVDIYDAKISGKLGKKLSCINSKKCYEIKNIDTCSWCEFDTLILGHTHDLEYFSKSEIKNKLINKCLENNVNLFSFDNEMLLEREDDFQKAGLHLYYPKIDMDKSLFLKLGKMYSIKSPILGVLGTSNQQGKFTLQLQLRLRFLQDGYNVAQLGTEPESLLFGMDDVYSFGFRSQIPFSNLESIEYLNDRIFRMDRKNPDIILVGSQAGTLPMIYNNIENYPLDRISFLLGTRPDAVILCINYHDPISEIKRIAAGIESLAKCKVVACSLFPIGFKNEWDIVRGAKSVIEREALQEFCKLVSDKTEIPCFILDEKEGPDSLYKECINFF